jgi:hypothetical protein
LKGYILMSKAKDYTLVLWGEQFDEAAAAIFITTLREAGLPVKVVGLTPRRLNGAHGLALVPDLTLSQALLLVDQTICVVIPRVTIGLKRLMNDPRLLELLRQAAVNQASLVVSHGAECDLANVAGVSAHINVYPGREDLVDFATELAVALVMMTRQPL